MDYKNERRRIDELDEDGIMGYYGWGDYSYTSVGDLKYKAEKFIEEKESDGETLFPIKLTGKIIAKSWWGKAWCDSLESYADYYSRLERGRKYVRANCVVDLQIEPGLVTALVIGSSKNPYKIKIRIDPISDEKLDELKKNCFSKIQNLESLINGNFPDDLKNLFMQKGVIFPRFSEIHFGCSCPDVADMCKHVASVLYGIGARFDNDPMLFFTLRGIETEKLIGNAIQSHIEKMLENVNTFTDRILDEHQVTGIFGL